MSSFGNAPGMHLQDLILDTKATATSAQKAECLKLLRTVVKNLADPTKKDDPKYRQLRLSNEKVAARLLPCPSGVLYMESIGFSHIIDSDGSKYLRIESTKQINVGDMQAALTEITNAYVMVAPDDEKGTSRKKGRIFSEEKKTPEGTLMSTDSSISIPSKLSEKQKARMLLEKRKKEEEAEAKKARARTRALIKQDKHVRENDENWKSCQSAACVKSGEKINTFREKFGE